MPIEVLGQILLYRFFMVPPAVHNFSIKADSDTGTCTGYMDSQIFREVKFFIHQIEVSGVCFLHMFRLHLLSMKVLTLLCEDLFPVMLVLVEDFKVGQLSFILPFHTVCNEAERNTVNTRGRGSLMLGWQYHRKIKNCIKYFQGGYTSA